MTYNIQNTLIYKMIYNTELQKIYKRVLLTTDSAEKIECTSINKGLPMLRHARPRHARLRPSAATAAIADTADQPIVRGIVR